MSDFFDRGRDKCEIFHVCYLFTFFIIRAGKALEAEHKGMKKGQELGHYAAAMRKLESASRVKVSCVWRTNQVTVCYHLLFFQIIVLP